MIRSAIPVALAAAGLPATMAPVSAQVRDSFALAYVVDPVCESKAELNSPEYRKYGDKEFASLCNRLLVNTGEIKDLHKRIDDLEGAMATQAKMSEEDSAASKAQVAYILLLAADAEGAVPSDGGKKKCLATERKNLCAASGATAVRRPG